MNIMDLLSRIVLFFYLTNSMALKINKFEVPSLVAAGTESLVLDCNYSLGNVTKASNLVVKWFFNQESLVYQWIPPRSPIFVGILKDKADKFFRVSDNPLLAHRAIKILKPTTELSGNYTCVVFTFEEEDYETRSLLIYSTPKRFEFIQKKKYVFIVTLVCYAEDLYPKPEMIIFYNDEPLSHVDTEVTMDSWGHYNISVTSVIHDDDVIGESGQYVCVLRLPNTGYTANKTTIYYRGLMPTVSIDVLENKEEAQRQADYSNGVSRKQNIFFGYSVFITYFTLMPRG